MREGVEIQIHEDESAAARAAADELVRLAGQAADEGRAFTVALTGGDSPRELYRLLATEEISSSIDWRNVHLLWGDERCVPPAHPRSNFGMAWRLFVSRVPIPAENVHRMPGELGPERGAERYEQLLRDLGGGDVPRLDLVYLGVGDDGHVASLFPFQLQNLTERSRLATSALAPEGAEPRISLTFPVLDHAARIRMLLPEAHQAGMVRRAIEGPLDPFRLPVQLVRARAGTQIWSLTEASAAELSRPH